MSGMRATDNQYGDNQNKQGWRQFNLCLDWLRLRKEDRGATRTDMYFTSMNVNKDQSKNKIMGQLKKFVKKVKIQTN